MVTDINRTFFSSCHRNILLSRNRFLTQIQDIEKFSAISCRYFSWEYLICRISSLLNKGEIAFLFIEGRSQPSNSFTKISPRTTSPPASFSLFAALAKSWDILKKSRITEHFPASTATNRSMESIKPRTRSTFISKIPSKFAFNFSRSDISYNLNLVFA